MKQDDKILAFIQRRFKEDCHWVDGNCYYFTVILQSRFPRGTIIYDPIEGHFLYKVGKVCYDFLGKHPLPEFFYRWDKLYDEDSSLYNRIKRDCIM